MDGEYVGAGTGTSNACTVFTHFFRVIKFAFIAFLLAE